MREGDRERESGGGHHMPLHFISFHFGRQTRAQWFKCCEKYVEIISRNESVSE